MGKGQPWMKGLLENQALFLSLTLCTCMTWICASGMIPQVNDLLQLEIVPDDLRTTMLVCLFMSLGGTLMWDRFCHWMFAPEIFAVMVENVKTTTFRDFFPVFKTIGAVLLVVGILATGNILSLVGLYYLYKNYYAESQPTKEAGNEADK